MSLDLSLYLVTDSRMAAAAGHHLIDLVQVVARAGVTAVQVREKDAPKRHFLNTVLAISEVLPANVLLLVNDRADVFRAARAAGARVDGMHIGQSDLPAERVRELIGTDAILGLSTSTEQQLRSATAHPARIDYVGVGILHPTTTKATTPSPLGHARFAQLVAVSTLPTVGIGGVRAVDLPRMRAAGSAGAAVVSAICSAPDPAAATRELRAAWDAR